MRTVRLVFRRLVAENLPNAFPNLQLGPGTSGIPVGKALAREVRDLRKKRLQLFNPLGQFLDGDGFGPGAGEF